MRVCGASFVTPAGLGRSPLSGGAGTEHRRLPEPGFQLPLTQAIDLQFAKKKTSADADQPVCAYIPKHAQVSHRAAIQITTSTEGKQ
jgi:hypothetical protein